MFEKEAKDYAIENYETCLYDDLPYANDSRAREQSFKDGAEFGYNKANEWHYVKDGDLPKENKPLLCVRGGNIYIAWYYNGVYHDNRCCQVKKPYAWKEIVPPKESE